MAATAQSHLERAELEAVLQSGIFHRAPNLERILRYVCERHFDGESGQVKEYSIAVDALGRDPDFDQRKDSIVRVEAHRLRKRLTDFYAGEGASHPVQILIPNGRYSPQFRYVDSHLYSGANGEDTDFGSVAGDAHAEVDPVDLDSACLQEDAVAHQVPAIEIPNDRKNKQAAWRRSFLLLAFTIAPIIAFAVWTKVHAGSRVSDETWKGSSSEPVTGDYRFLAGYHGASFRDRQGRTWQADAYYTGGQSQNMPVGRHFEGVPDPGFLRSAREGVFKYDIPVRDGTYEVHLYFAETQADEPRTDRLFRVGLNGRTVLDPFDVAAEAGTPNRLLERVFRDVTPAADRKIHISFAGVSNHALLNAAEILATPPGEARPVRLVASETSVADAEGRVWTADQYFVGGRLVKRTEGSVESHSRQLYDGERYGDFSYYIPVPPGKYRLRLFFAESWFGSRLPYAPSELIGARVFNVFANGVALLRDFDIAKEAQGSKKGIEKVFENLEPNAQNQIVLEFVPVRNFAEVNAIEITQMQ